MSEKKQIPSKYFSEILKTGKVLVSKNNVNAGFNFNTNSGIEVENICFTGQIDWSNNNAQFNKQLIFRDVEFENMKLDKSYFRFEIIFERCNFKKQFELNISGHLSLQFDDCKFEDNVIFNLGIFKEIIFNECEGKNLLSIVGRKNKRIAFLSNTFSEISLENEIGEVNFKEHKDGKITFNTGDYHKIDFENSTISRLHFGKASYLNINIKNLCLDEFINVDESNILKMVFENLYGPGKLEINSESIKDLIVSYSFFDNISFKNYLPESSNITIEQSDIRQIHFTDLMNKGMVRLSEIEIPEGGMLSIVNSEMGKTNFLRCNFRECKFEFENSKVPEVFLAETDFPRKIFIGRIANYHQAQLVFGQLHNTYLKQGDSIRAHEYQAREVEALYQSLPFFENRLIRMGQQYFNFKWFVKQLFTKLSLGLNKLSNDHGRNWMKGVIFSFAVGFILFYLLLISTKEYYFAWTPKFKYAMVEPFLKFMNPLRHFETQTLFTNKPKATLTTTSYIIDYLARILVAYGFYQTIQAFRRYGRK